MKCVFFTNINCCYPVNVRGMFMALSSLVSLAVLWTQSYIVACIQIEDDISVYFHSQLAIAVFVLLLSPVIYLRIMSLDPKAFRRLDQSRVNANSAGTQPEKRRVSVAVGIDYHRTTTADDLATVAIRETLKLSVVGVSLRDSIFKRPSRRSSSVHVQ